MKLWKIQQVQQLETKEKIKQNYLIQKNMHILTEINNKKNANDSSNDYPDCPSELQTGKWKSE